MMSLSDPDVERAFYLSVARIIHCHGLICFAPVFDFLNSGKFTDDGDHPFEHNMGWKMVDEKKDGVSWNNKTEGGLYMYMHVKRDVKAGQQILGYPYAFDTAALLRDYGFIESYPRYWSFLKQDQSTARGHQAAIWKFIEYGNGTTALLDPNERPIKQQNKGKYPPIDLHQFVTDAQANLDATLKFEQESDAFRAAKRFVTDGEEKCNEQYYNGLYEGKYNFTRKYVTLGLEYRQAYIDGMRNALRQHTTKSQVNIKINSEVMYNGVVGNGSFQFKCY